MASPLRESAARIKAAYAAGDEAALRDALADYKAGKASLRRSMDNIRKDQESYNPTSGMSGAEKFHVGMARGLSNIGRRAGNLVGAVSDDTIDKYEETDRALMDTGAGAAGSFLTETAVTAPIAGGAGAGARALMLKQALRNGADAARLGLTAGKLRRGASYALEGAIGGELTSGDAGTGAGLGAVLTPGLNRLGRVGSWLGRGSHRSAEAEHLLDLGADLTPGQLNPHSRMARFEGAAREAPLNIGRGIREAQDTALKPVVPNQAADIAEIGRSGKDLTAREGLERSHKAVQSVFDETSNQPLDAAEIARLRGDARSQARLMREARRDTRRSVELQQNDLRMAADEAEEMAVVARRRANDDPTPLNIAKADRAESKAAKIRDRADNIDPNEIIREGNRDARRVARGFVQEPMKDLQSTLQSSIKARGVPRTAASVKLVTRLGKNVLRARNTSEIKDAISELKAKSRALKYKADPTPADFDEAKVLDDAREWFEKQLESAIKDPAALARLQKANKQYGELVPLEEAAFSQGADPSGLVPGTKIEKAVQANMTRGGYFEPAKRGRVLRTGEALRSVEQGASKNALQQAGLPFILKLPQSLIGTAGSSKLVRTMAQGRAGFQRPAVQLSKAMNARQRQQYEQLRRRGVGKKLARALATRDRYLRAAVPGALTDTEE